MHLSSGQVVIFFLSIGVMLLFAKLFGELFNKLKQPAIIGEIIAGIILGPTVFGMLFPGIFNWLFPQTNEVKIALDGITTLAVVLLLLVSGLEVDLSTVLRYRKTAVTTSLMGIIFPFTLGFGLIYFYPNLISPPNDQLHLAFALFMGTAIAISSLPVIAKILMDLNIFKTQVGFIIISAAMLNDLIGWLIFSLILGMLGATTGGISFGFTLLLVMFFVFFTLLFGRKISNKFISVIQDKFSFPGGILNFILIAGFFGAAFTEFIGVHAILGAFIVGIAIGDSAHLKEETRLVIQQFITNIFAPLFFVSIGLRVNFIANFNLTIVIIILILAMVGKVAGSSLGARIGGMDKKDSLTVGFGMCSSGAMGIILGVLALQYGLIQEEIFVGLVIMALFTSIVSAPLMSYFIKKEKSYRLEHLITPDMILFSNSNEKNELLRQLINLTEKTIKADKERVLKGILEREETNPTGISNYLAIPHARVNLTKPVAAVAVHSNGINFDAVDGLPTKIIVLLLTPENESELQLRLLAEIVRKFKDKSKIENLIAIKSKEEFVECFNKL